MKKLVSILLVFAIMLSFSACGAAKPEDTVKSYLSAYKNYDKEKMATYVLETDEATTLGDDDDDEEFLKPFEEYMESNASKMTYTITNTEVDGSQAVVTVAFRYVDGSDLIKAVMGRYMQEMFASAFSDEDISEEQIQAKLSEIMKAEINNVPETFADDTLEIKCVLKDKTWYIDDLSDDVVNVLSSGIVGTMTDIGESFDALGFDS